MCLKRHKELSTQSPFFHDVDQYKIVKASDGYQPQNIRFSFHSKTEVAEFWQTNRKRKMIFANDAQKRVTVEKPEFRLLSITVYVFVIIART